MVELVWNRVGLGFNKQGQRIPIQVSRAALGLTSVSRNMGTGLLARDGSLVQSVELAGIAVEVQLWEGPLPDPNPADLPEDRWYRIGINTKHSALTGLSLSDAGPERTSWTRHIDNPLTVRKGDRLLVNLGLAQGPGYPTHYCPFSRVSVHLMLLLSESVMNGWNDDPLELGRIGV